MGEIKIIFGGKHEKDIFGNNLIDYIIGCTGGATSAVSSVANSNGMTLDQALKEAAERIEAGSKIVPLNFNSPPR